MIFNKKKKKTISENLLNFKSLLKTSFIPLLIVIIAMGVYFFVFLGIKNDILPKTQHLYQDTSHLTQESPIDSLLAFLGLKTRDTPEQPLTQESSAQTTTNIKSPDTLYQPPNASLDETNEVAQAEIPQPIEHTDIQTPNLDEQSATTTQIASEEKPQESKEYISAFVQVSTAVIRSAPSTQSPSVMALSSGRKLEVVSFDDDWFEVKEPRGYVAKRLLRISGSVAQQSPQIPSQPTQSQSIEVSSDSNVYEVLANRVNVRSAPNTDAPIIAALSLGQTVRVSSFNDGWATIILDSGRKAYIIARAIKKV